MKGPSANAMERLWEVCQESCSGRAAWWNIALWDRNARVAGLPLSYLLGASHGADGLAVPDELGELAVLLEDVMFDPLLGNVDG
jgi:L-alanine-DL-glutamate epimerase-like enolase superfamily enzyme